MPVGCPMAVGSSSKDCSCTQASPFLVIAAELRGDCGGLRAAGTHWRGDSCHYQLIRHTKNDSLHIYIHRYKMCRVLHSGTDGEHKNVKETAPQHRGLRPQSRAVPGEDGVTSMSWKHTSCCSLLLPDHYANELPPALQAAVASSLS